MTGRRVWLLAALAACAALVAVTQTAGSVELLDRHSGIRALEAKSEDHAFANDWDGWLRKVTLQVKAAVDLARGLPASKTKRLDAILEADMAKDMTSGEAMAAGLQGKRGASASARRKAAVQAASNSLAKIATSRDEEIEKAAPHVTESQIKAPVPMEGKSAIDPYGKMLGNKVATDDEVVEADEMHVKMAEKRLEAEEGQVAGVSSPRSSPAVRMPSRSRHAARVASARAAAAGGHRVAAARAAAGGHVLSERKDDLVAAKALKSSVQAKPALQGDINLVLQSTPGDKKKAAQEEKQEESEFAVELHKLGLASAPERKPKYTVTWPSQLELPGEGARAKANSDNN